MPNKLVAFGVTGSIAAYKTPTIVRGLKEHGLEVRVVMTKAAARFIGPLSLSVASKNPVISDLWQAAQAGEVGHVELAAQADALVIAPCSADTLAKLATGRADDPIASIALSIPQKTPRLLAPAMETHMWLAASTQRNTTQLQADGYQIIGPATGPLASGRSGLGRLAPEALIVESVLTALSDKTLEGKRVMINAGPTREYLDPVRFLSNPSSGKMGLALARQAARQGAEVDLVMGPTSLDLSTLSQNISIHRAISTDDLWKICKKQIEAVQPDIVIMAAAPCDYRPLNFSLHKIKKSPDNRKVELERTPDLLRELSSIVRGYGGKVVGFAAETQELVSAAKAKLDKGADMIVANLVGQSEGGFGDDNNRAILVTRHHELEQPMQSKDELAQQILKQISQLPEKR